jgi:hypothetical protein
MMTKDVAKPREGKERFIINEINLNLFKATINLDRLWRNVNGRVGLKNARKLIVAINFVYSRDKKTRGNKETFMTHLITKNFDLTVTSVGDVGVARILERVNLYVQRKTLKGKRSWRSI